MAQQQPANLPNGIPPQMGGFRSQPPQFNGVHSSQSSRDSSPSARLGQIPATQLPPGGRAPIPSSQLPPSRSPQTVVQKMGLLNIAPSPKFTSTPNQSLQPVVGLTGSGFSPIPPLGGTPQAMPKSDPRKVFAPTNDQFETIPLTNQNSEPTLRYQEQQHQPPQPVLNNALNNNHNNMRQTNIQGQMLPRPVPIQPPRPVPIQPSRPMPVQPPLNQGAPPQIQQQFVGRGPPQPPNPAYLNTPSLPNNQGPPVLPKIPSSASQPQLSQYQNSRPPALAGQPPQQFQQNFAPPGPPQPTQFKNALHTNRYPQGPVPPQPLPVQSNLQQPVQNFQQQHHQQHPQQSPGYQQPQQNNVMQSGFNRLWGQDSFDLLQNPNVLPAEKVIPPRIHLGQDALDAVNCSPEVFRCTMTKIPESSALLQKSRLPLGVLIHPFKDMSFLTVIQSENIVRCRSCRTYINPFVFFIDTKRWKCNLCYRINELPEEFMYDPLSRTYGDPSRRPEIKTATVEYIAPGEYMLRPPQPAVYLFLFDVSRLAVESGYLQSVCDVLLENLKNLPGDARTQVGIIAYDSALHFYSLGEGLSQPHEMTVLDIEDVFLPCPDNLLVNLKDRGELLTDLLGQLPTKFNNSYDNHSALGAALQAAHKMMGPTGGRITIFQASLPNVGPGSLPAREDPSQRASSEVLHLNPANDFYKRLALECSAQQIAVDLFVLNSQYVDIATLSGISRFSGGCIHHYPLFKASKVTINEQFERELRRYLTRKIGFEAVMRIRCTRGLSIHTFHGNFFVRSTGLLSLPNINPDAGFGMQVSIDENLSDIQSVCFQAALLYTSSRGERRVRVHTMCIPICATLSDVINSADQQCIVGLLAKMAVDRSMQSSLSDAREAFINVAIDTLSIYKMSLNTGTPPSGLLAPQCLRLLPLYISALLKHVSFRIGSSTRLDDRVKAMIDMKTKPLFQIIQMVYPDLYPVHNLDECKVILNADDEPVPQPPHMQLTARCLDSKGAFLMDTGDHMIVLVSPGVSPTFLNEALGVRDYVSIPDDLYELPILDNLHNQRLHQFIAHLNEDKPFPATLHVIRDNSPHRLEFFERLIEDRHENALSYHEFLQHLKTQVK